jgi:hypothetical protein
MARVLALTAGFLAACLAGCSPFGGGAFRCDQGSIDPCNAQAGGRCEPDGLCSYADEGRCGPGGRSYGDNSGDKSGDCVGGGGGDGGIDASSEFCYGDSNGLVKPCFSSEPTGTRTLTNPIDTSMAATCMPVLRGAEGLCVIAAQTIRVEELVHVIGSKPLVLVATNVIEISGTLDAASHRGLASPYTTAFVGAGANPGGDACNAGTPPVASGGAGGGGAGGTLTAPGGNGGNSKNGGGTEGGTAGTAPTIMGLRGGCRGQDGINGTPGLGGNGGGALYLIAKTEIRISGQINASGEGGHPGDTGFGGGGGGGSGGMLGFDAPTIMNNGAVYANGGGGGEGSGMVTEGAPGQEATNENQAPASQSFSNGGVGGAGGAGGPGTGPANGSAGESVDGFGGGGGGGGTGLIKVFQGSLTGKYSPSPTS